jgi:hypothetical protein
MLEYIDVNGVILDRYEFNGGLSIKDKVVAKQQSSRRREIKRGTAIIVDFDDKYR